ncbi:MAG: SDR family NAD(P)-dependent oxidoreductase, partial [Pseudomonadota bacterium]
LQASPIKSTIIAPSGFFSDLSDFFDMAKAGRAVLFGSGELKLNPIDGADLAEVIAGAIWDGREYVPVGGPEVMTQNELAEAAFIALGKPAKITYVPDVLRRLALKLLPYVTPSTLHGPALFFLSALGMDMVGTQHGRRHVADHFAQLARAQATPADPNKPARLTPRGAA